MSADEELGYVYLPFGAATNDFYGGHRHGDNLFATSLVCLNAETGKRVWHFQTVHHDLWDYDLPCAPNLVDVVVDGKLIKAVAQVSKTGYCYVFDRGTGEPVWPINEVPVPQSTLPGEKTSPTQPIPTKPPPFPAQGITEDHLHHSNFPPYSVGETRPMRGPGRREIGHGALAERAVRVALPDQEDFPYVIRVVSDILESNGSTSMAAVCGSTLALMDAGVPLVAPSSGIGMGLMTHGAK